MSNVNFNNPVRTGAPKANATTGPINVQELEKLVDSLPIADSMAVKGGAAAETAELPAIFQQLSARDKQTLMELPASVRQKVLAGAPADVDAAKYQISQELLSMATKLVPGSGIKFEPARAFRVSDAAIAYGVIADMSVADRQRLEGITFKRVKSTFIEHEALNRDVDGAAAVNIEEGKGMGGKVGSFFARMFEKWSLTAPLGLMLRSWFPHAMAEYRNREVHIGDAQATRMKEVLVHEIGHQVQFGKEPNLGEMREWAKLSGWKNATTGEEAFGLTASGQLTGFDPNVRPTKTNNFVYEDFTEDLSPEVIKQAADAIKDPELKAEFLTTAKVKRNMREAIKETFGVDAKGYSMTNPLEDFAESFRAFQIDPELLVKKAPDKFLFLNANSRKYTPEQVAVFFERSNKNANKVATEIATTGVTQETVDKIFKANGLKADIASLARSASREMSSGAAVPAFRQVFMEIQKRVGERDLTFVNSFTKDPAGALGNLWGQLNDAERAQFAEQNQRVDVVLKMQQGLMSYASAASQGLAEVEKQAISELGGKLLDAVFLDDAQKDPAAALEGLAGYENLPASLKQVLSTPEGRDRFKAFAGSLSTMVSADNVWLLGGGDLRAKVSEGLAKWDSETLDMGIKLLAEKPEDAAKYFAGMKLTADGIVPPGGN